MAVFVLNGLKGRVDEITELLDDLEKEIWAQYRTGNNFFIERN